MTTITRTTLALLLTSAVALPVLAQYDGANRTGPGIPAPKPPANKIAIVEDPEARRCRLHCEAYATTAYSHLYPNAVVFQARREACEKKMLHTR
jgi:hypothetical protein